MLAALGELPADARAKLAPPVASAKAEFGDLQIASAMALAKPLGKKPREVAEVIKRAVAEDAAVAKTEIAGPGFVNIWLENAWLAEAANRLLRSKELGLAAEPHSRGKVVLDYSSPNAAKPMHVAHIRSTIIGDALRRALGAVGYEVVPVNHLGDWGTQFGKLIVAYRRWVDAEAFARDAVGELLRLYIKFGEVEKAERGVESSDDDEELAPQNETAAAPILLEARRELVKLQQGDAENLALWRRFRDASVEQFKGVYRRIGVDFRDEDFIGESFFNDKLEATVEELRQRGIAEESRGAMVVFFRNPDGSDRLPPMLVRKADGGYLYGTSDIAALKYRTERWHPQRIIVITDERQQLHFKQLAEVGRLLGITNFEHVWFGLMRLPEGTISTREGKIVSLEALLDEAERRAYEVARAQRQDLSEAELREVARVVGLGAVKYNDLSRDRQTLVTFTFDKALSLTGNTAPYLQYAYARIRSILRKAESPPGELGQALEPVERELVKRLLWFPAAVERVAVELRPHTLADYLYELADAFSTFYNEHPVLKAEPAVRASRLALCQLVARTLQTGLDLLGIEVLERM
jgi:arginyl-tRNA synthetase